MENTKLIRLKYAHEHLFRMQTYVEAKNGTVLTANLVMLANIDKIQGSNNYAVFALLIIFVCSFVSACFALLSFFPNVRGAADTKSVLFFEDTKALDSGEALVELVESADVVADELLDTANQIVIVSKIVSAKTRSFAYALAWFSIAASIYLGAMFAQNLTWSS